MPSDQAIHIAALHDRLRAFLLAEMGQEPPENICSALMYELVSLVAAGSESELTAMQFLQKMALASAAQLAANGVGHPHP